MAHEPQWPKNSGIVPGTDRFIGKVGPVDLWSCSVASYSSGGGVGRHSFAVLAVAGPHEEHTTLLLLRELPERVQRSTVIPDEYKDAVLAAVRILGGR